MNEMERTDNISGFELSRDDGYSSMSAMFIPRAEHDLTVHFVGDVVQQVQEATHDRP